MSRILWTVAWALSLVAFSAQGFSAETHDQRVARANNGTVSVISGGIGGTYLRIATDLAAVLDERDKVRILPIAGKGSLQNIRDILYLKGIDVGIVQSDVLAYIKRERLHPGIDKRLRYVAKLFNEEFHLLARDTFTDINQLAGQKVNFGDAEGGAHITASTVFEGLGISVQSTTFDPALALDKLKKGEIAAMAFVAAKPAPLFDELTKEDGLRLIDVPYTQPLLDLYLPSGFTEADYTALVPAGQQVDTVAVGAVMAVFNWGKRTRRYRKTEKFVEAFFSNFDQFLKSPRHGKWQEVNLAAQVPGWKRFDPATTWLEKNAPVAKPVAASDLEETFQDFLAQQPNSDFANLTEAQRQELFQQFIRWRKGETQ